MLRAMTAIRIIMIFSMWARKVWLFFTRAFIYFRVTALEISVVFTVRENHVKWNTKLNWQFHVENCNVVGRCYCLCAKAWTGTCYLRTKARPLRRSWSSMLRKCVYDSDRARHTARPNNVMDIIAALSQFSAALVFDQRIDCTALQTNHLIKEIIWLDTQTSHWG